MNFNNAKANQVFFRENNASGRYAQEIGARTAALRTTTTLPDIEFAPYPRWICVGIGLRKNAVQSLNSIRQTQKNAARYRQRFFDFR